MMKTQRDLPREIWQKNKKKLYPMRSWSFSFSSWQFFEKIFSPLTNNDHLAISFDGIKTWRFAGNFTTITSGWWKIHRLQHDDRVRRVVELIFVVRKNSLLGEIMKKKFFLSYINGDSILWKDCCRWLITWQISIKLVPIFIPLHRVEFLVFHIVVTFKSDCVILHCVVGHTNFNHS